ncbi:hypothetical protein CJ030_MR2G013614 [Morella rubra]|uniref:Uncharacterized protein n=1 Tax=Morella rubra TaxID=262757 RepID=A0A6A1WEU4_9ROSI|nr:hypothetical protein CJ030_MR2G013614 [Morella rubra]
MALDHSSSFFGLGRMFDEHGASGSSFPPFSEVLPSVPSLIVEGEVSYSKALMVRPEDSPLFVSPCASSVPDGGVGGEVP